MLNLTELYGFNASIGSSGGFIKSVTKINITIGVSSTSNTQTVNVDATNSILIWNGCFNNNPGTENAAENMATVTLTDGTTVTANRNTGGSGTVTVKATLVEFYSGVLRSVQYGSITITGTNTSNTASISSVTTTNSAVFFLGNYSDITAVTRNSTYCRLDLTSSTVVTATRNTGTSGNVVCKFVVAEFNSGVLQSNTQAVAFSETINDTSNFTISNITTGNAILAYGGQSGLYSSSMNSAYLAQIWIAGSTTVTWQRDTIGSGQININATVIEFKAADVSQSAQRGNTTPVTDGSTSTNVALGVAISDTSKALVTHCGVYATAGSGVAGSMTEVSVELLDANNIKLEHGPDSGTPTLAPAWETISLRGAA